MQLVFATNNEHKVQEVNAILRGVQLVDFEIITMKSVGQTDDLPETHDTIRENAQEKAQYLYQKYQVACFSEDTGLEIDALGGEPGVHTAHYSGTRDPKQNMALVLQRMGDTNVRSARFRTVICLIIDGKEHLFEGVCEGKIATAMSGTEGFGYDPIFTPEGYDKTFAELDSAVKNAISHRAKATQLLIDFLSNWEKKAV